MYAGKDGNVYQRQGNTWTQRDNASTNAAVKRYSLRPMFAKRSSRALSANPA